MDELTFKKLDTQKDILYAQKNEVEELFYPQQGITKPYNSTNNLTIETTDPPSVNDNPDEYNEITYVKNENSGINYFSYARGEKNNYTAGQYTGLMYNYILSLLQPSNSTYQVDIEGSFFDINKFDVISVTREWYRDSIDPNFFAVFINTASSTPTSTVSNFASGSGVLGLYPSKREYQSKLGEKRYLYATSSTANLYDQSSDTLTMLSDEDLVMDMPYGELLVETGIVILYLDRIEELQSTTTSALHYVAGIMGRSRTQVNSTIFYCRATNSEFNYTTNRSFYRDDAENIVKQEFRDNPTTFITAIGLYNDKNQCVAYGRVSQPIKKDFTKESNIIAEINL